MIRRLSDTVPVQVIEAIEEKLGPSGCIHDADEMAPYLADRRGKYVANTPLIARPKDTDEVSAVMGICHRHGVGVVPQGGNTGLVGGSVPDESGTQILLSLERLRRVREVDRLNYSITVEAGCVLADVQSAASNEGLLFPLSLAAEGSCQIGGNLGTNAGGTQVLRYGNTRDLVLGLEVVLADGRVWGRFAPAQERQHRLQPETSVHWLGRDLGSHHRGHPQAFPAQQTRAHRSGSARQCPGRQSFSRASET